MAIILETFLLTILLYRSNRFFHCDFLLAICSSCSMTKCHKNIVTLRRYTATFSSNSAFFFINPRGYVSNNILKVLLAKKWTQLSIQNKNYFTAIVFSKLSDCTTFETCEIQENFIQVNRISTGRPRSEEFRKFAVSSFPLFIRKLPLISLTYIVSLFPLENWRTSFKLWVISNRT